MGGYKNKAFQSDFSGGWKSMLIDHPLIESRVKTTWSTISLRASLKSACPSEMLKKHYKIIKLSDFEMK